MERNICFQHDVFPEVCAFNTLHRGANLPGCGLFRLHIDVFPARSLFYAGDSLHTPLSRYIANGAKVNLTEFLRTDHLHLARSLDVPGVRDSSSPLQQGNVIDSITGSAENAGSQIGGHAQDLSDQLHSLLPEYYTVGLWSYYEGKQGDRAFSNCSGPSASFSFDLVNLLSNRLGQANGMLSD